MIANRLKTIREYFKKSVDDFSQIVQLQSRTYRSYERGERKPPIELLVHLVEYLNINPLWLLTGKSSMLIEEQKMPQLTELSKLISQEELNEEEAIRIFELYLNTPSKQAFELLVSASKGDKSAIESLSHYLEGLKHIADK